MNVRGMCTQQKCTVVVLVLLVTVLFVFLLNPISEKSQVNTYISNAVSKPSEPKIATKRPKYVPEGFEYHQNVNYQFSDIPKQEGIGFTLITMFNLFTGQTIAGFGDTSVESLVLRNSEYLTTIRENINHHIVKKIILLYVDENSLKILLAQNWKNTTKVHPVKLNRLIHMSDFFNYSSSYLLDVPVIASNGDIIIGEHFDKIDIDRLRDTKTLYSLTRHGNKGFGGCEERSMCLIPYLGSHDTHVFRLKQPISAQALDMLDYPINSFKAENAMHEVMTDEGFTVYNPCRLLTTYHIHCSNLRKKRTPSNHTVKAIARVVNVRIIEPNGDLQYAQN